MNAGISGHFSAFTMCPTIRNYDEQAIDHMSEESEKKPLSFINFCGLFQVKAG